MSNLLNTLLSLLDDIHELKKQIYFWEYDGKSDEHTNLYLQRAIEEAELEKKVLHANYINHILSQSEDLALEE